MDADVYESDFGLAYDPMICPLAYYSCFNCRALFTYPVDANPICGECEYDGFNAALLVQAMDEEVQTDDLPARHALAVEPAWQPITLTARGSDFISASPLSAASTQSDGSTRNGEDFNCPAGDACVQTTWKHAPGRTICDDVDWWPGSTADRAAAPPGYSLADRGYCSLLFAPQKGGASKVLSLTTLFMCVGEVQSANFITEIAAEQTPFVRYMIVGFCVLAIVKLLLHLKRKQSLKNATPPEVNDEPGSHGGRYPLDPLSTIVGVVVRLAYSSVKRLIHGMIGRVQLAAVTMDNFMLHVRERKKPVYLQAYYASTTVAIMMVGACLLFSGAPWS
jgi:hypothetical protein